MIQMGSQFPAEKIAGNCGLDWVKRPSKWTNAWIAKLRVGCLMGRVCGWIYSASRVEVPAVVPLSAFHRLLTSYSLCDIPANQHCSIGNSMLDTGSSVHNSFYHVIMRRLS